MKHWVNKDHIPKETTQFPNGADAEQFNADPNIKFNSEFFYQINLLSYTQTAEKSKIFTAEVIYSHKEKAWLEMKRRGG